MACARGRAQWGRPSLWGRGQGHVWAAKPVPWAPFPSREEPVKGHCWTLLFSGGPGVKGPPPDAALSRDRTPHSRLRLSNEPTWQATAHSPTRAAPAPRRSSTEQTSTSAPGRVPGAGCRVLGAKCPQRLVLRTANRDPRAKSHFCPGTRYGVLPLRHFLLVKNISKRRRFCDS